MNDVLQYLLLFLLAQAPFTGYDIRHMFQSSPVGRFSDSPGAIYPALARLEKRGWATSRAEEGGRRRRLYSATAAGRRALRLWLVTPVAPADVERRPDVLALRYVMVAEFCTSAETVTFLEGCSTYLADHITALKAYLAGPHGLPTSSVEATEHGVALAELQLSWFKKLATRHKRVAT
jgi:DNA-binding PadR family transcriptional regulator